MKIVYSNRSWKIKKREDMYRTYHGKKLIDESDNFEEAYSLLDKHKKSTK